MDKNFKCLHETHENELITGFCFNQMCSKPSQFCFQCLIQIHQDHPKDCIKFNQLTLLISQYIQAQKELITNYKDLQNQLTRTFENYFKRMESDIKILIEMDQQLKNRSYNTFKEKISFIKEYYSNNKQNQNRCLLIIIIIALSKQMNLMKSQQLLKESANQKIQKNNYNRQMLVKFNNKVYKKVKAINQNYNKINKKLRNVIKKEDNQQQLLRKITLYNKGQFDEAIKLFDESLKNDNNQDFFYRMKGLALFLNKFIN